MIPLMPVRPAHDQNETCSTCDQHMERVKLMLVARGVNIYYIRSCVSDPYSLNPDPDPGIRVNPNPGVI
jgi:hypothetical protein